MGRLFDQAVLLPLLELNAIINSVFTNSHTKVFLEDI